MSAQTVQSICFECHSRCGVRIDVADGRLQRIRGDKSHPFSRGYTCPKGRAAPEIVYHPERITTPLINIGSRKSPKFEAASWDKALSLIAEKLLSCSSNFGPESVVFGSGTTRGMAPYLNR